MKEKANIAIGIPTYNSADRVNELLISLKLFTDYPEDGYKIVCLDDGTPDKSKVNALKQVCAEFNAPLIELPENKGIPYAWNRLTEYYDAEIVVLLNDDVRICSSGWLSAGEYFLRNNEKIGTVGWPLIQVDPNTQTQLNSSREWGSEPGRVGSAVGTCFMFYKHNWEKVKNIDGTTGFCEALGSFHEELLFNFKLYELSYSSWMLCNNPTEHWHSRTFSLNPELTWMKWSDKYFSKEDFLTVIDSSELYTPDWRQLLRNKINNEGLVDRMGYSRMLFWHMYGRMGSYDCPQIAVHDKFVTPHPYPDKLTWLDASGQPKEVSPEHRY